jgi:hypothetical protein
MLPLSVSLQTANSNSLLPNTASNDIQQHVNSANSGDVDTDYDSQSDCHSDSNSCANSIQHFILVISLFLLAFFSKNSIFSI